MIDLDSNGNDVLDDGYLYVEVEAVTHGGVTKRSTMIGTAGFTGRHLRRVRANTAQPEACAAGPLIP